MICNQCNHKLPNDSVFCQYCGNKIEKNVISPIEKTNNETTKHKRFNKLSIAVIILSLFLILSVVFNVIQYIDRAELNEEKWSLIDKSTKLEYELNKYKESEYESNIDWEELREKAKEKTEEQYEQMKNAPPLDTSTFH